MHETPQKTVLLALPQRNGPAPHLFALPTYRDGFRGIPWRVSSRDEAARRDSRDVICTVSFAQKEFLPFFFFFLFGFLREILPADSWRKASQIRQGSLLAGRDDQISSHYSSRETEKTETSYPGHRNMSTDSIRQNIFLDFAPVRQKRICLACVEMNTGKHYAMSQDTIKIVLADLQFSLSPNEWERGGIRP